MIILFRLLFLFFLFLFLYIIDICCFSSRFLLHFIPAGWYISFSRFFPLFLADISLLFLPLRFPSFSLFYAAFYAFSSSLLRCSSLLDYTYLLFFFFFSLFWWFHAIFFHFMLMYSFSLSPADMASFRRYAAASICHASSSSRFFIRFRCSFSTSHFRHCFRCW